MERQTQEERGVTTMAERQREILARLGELAKLDFPQYRSYRTAEGEWIDREPVPEYLEQQELIRRWQELQAIERYFGGCHNRLLVGLRLSAIADGLSCPTRLVNKALQHRIAVSVGGNVQGNLQQSN